MADDHAISVDYVAGQLEGLKGLIQQVGENVTARLEQQDRQHVIDKTEAIAERDRRHAENTLRLEVINQKINDAAVIAAHGKDWIETVGNPMQLRVSSLEKNRADLERRNEASRWFSKGAGVVWAGIVAVVGSIITALVTLGGDGIKAILHALGMR